MRRSSDQLDRADDELGASGALRRPSAGSESPAPADELPPRGAPGLLRDRVFGPFWLGKLLSTAGIWVHNVVAAIVTYQVSRSTLMVGAVTVAQFAPQLLFAPLSGAQADRGNPRRQLIAGRAIAAIGSLGLAVVIGVVGVDGLPNAWPVIASAGVVGIGFVVGGPAMHALLPTLVRPSELPAAVALNHLPPTLARSGGPVLGALLLVTVGPAWAFAFTGVTNLLFSLVIISLPIHREPRDLKPGDGTVRAGLRYLRGDPAVMLFLVGVLALGFGADPVVTMTPALSDAFGRGEQLVGIFASAFGIGAAAVFPLLRILRDRVGVERLGVAGLACLSAGLLVSGAAAVPAVAVAGMAIGGVGFSVALTCLTTALYTQVPDVYRGRMMALWSMAFLGSRPIAAVVNGSIADASSVGVAFAVAAVLVASVAVLTGVGGRRNRARRPAGSDHGAEAGGARGPA